MWPNARISVMGGKQAALVLSQVMKAQKQRLGQEVSLISVCLSFCLSVCLYVCLSGCLLGCLALSVLFV